jgi:hypothetical protein
LKCKHLFSRFGVDNVSKKYIAIIDVKLLSYYKYNFNITIAN